MNTDDAGVLGAGGQEHALVTRRRASRCAVRSKLRPPIAAAAWPGIGDIGGRYTYRRLGGCGDRSRKRAPNSSMMRSSSGSTPCRSASLHHSPISSGSLSGCVGGQVVALRHVGREVVQLPRLGVVVGARLMCLQTAFHAARSTIARLPAISKYCSVLVGGGAGVGERRGERMAGDRELLEPVEAPSGGVTPSSS